MPPSGDGCLYPFCLRQRLCYRHPSLPGSHYVHHIHDIDHNVVVGHHNNYRHFYYRHFNDSDNSFRNHYYHQL